MRQPTAPQSRVTPRVLATMATAVVAVITLAAATAATAGASGDPGSQRDQVRKKKAEAAARLNVLKANDAQINRALDAIEANVSAQQARVASARQAANAADAALAKAKQQEQQKQQELETLRTRMKKLAVDAYINPTTGDLAATLSAKSIGDATRKREFLQFRASRNTDLVDRVKAAREDLGITRQNAESAQKKAADRKRSVEATLATFQHSLRQQEALAAQIEAKSDAARAELDGYDRQDADLTRQIAIAAAASRASRSRGSGAIVNRGGLSTVRGITVASSIADNLAAMLDAADADGYSFSGGGYRDPSEQIAVRRANCGTSDYAIYEMPASQCSPPTARPGTSMHEQGLAIDFSWNGRIIGSRSSPAYQWLARNAARYGFYNLPSEPWHWSTNGN
jgi:LAS superfamily LD-carboxypeptidase LdcB